MAADLAALLDRYERPLVRYAQSVVGDLESARDVVQDTFIRLAHEMSKSHPAPPSAEPAPPAGDDEKIVPMPGAWTADAKHVEAWLFTVCRHRAIDHQRKFSRIVAMPLPEDRTDPGPGPAAQAESRDTEQSLLALLVHLSPNQQEVIRLKFQNDLSYKEIAEVTQLSVTNVGFLLHTGLKKLRALVIEQPDFSDLPIRLSS
jgi:DNA-directed RNA polymerase specialized sigma24 family protein